jgi:ABC-2 type transport system ATP-binding protein
MMKRGEIVDDGSPETLLARYGRETLEDVFLDIARGRRQAKDKLQDRAQESEQGAER